MMADHRRTLTVLGPVAARMSFSGGKARPSAVEPVRMSCWLTTNSRPGMRRPFSERPISTSILFLSEWSSSTFAATSCPLGVHPRPFANAIACVDRGFPAFRLGAEIGAPRLASCTCLCRQILAVLVGAFDATKVGPVWTAGACDEERHIGKLRWRCLRLRYTALANGATNAVRKTKHVLLDISSSYRVPAI
jgi:hypothetical protein